MSDNISPRNRPVVLRPDNFTPPERTPWGGRRILERYKDGLRLEASGVVGESWEVSVEPDFPAIVDGRASEAVELDGRPLTEVIASDREGWLGAEAPLGGAPLLVKLLDAATPLSVQIHPSDDDPALGLAESGKPESWLITEADAGAGLYLGLQPGVDEAAMRRAIEGGADVSALLPFVPVAPGDFFLIEAGTPHAIGGGVTLVEPQRVLPGKRGLTYRYWDWNRRYDPDGRPDDAGTPRALHVDEALRVTRWDLPRGDALLEQVRVRAGVPDPTGTPVLTPLSGPAEAPLRSNTLEVASLGGSGPMILPASPGFRALTVIGGALTIDGLRLERGRSAALPAAQAHELVLDEAWAVLSRALEG
jgi:mannose-6-phosphate isomerase class I